MLAALCRLPDSDMQPYVVSLLSNGLLVPELRASGVPVLELGFSKRLPNPVGLIRLALLIRREKPDVVQGWMYHGDLAALFALWLSGRRKATRLVWGIRCSDMDLSRYGVVVRHVVRICARLSRQPDMVIANSDAGRVVHEALGYRPRRFEVVHNGIDIGRFAPNAQARAEIRAELGISENRVVFAHVARVDPMKDHPAFLAAMARFPDTVGIMVGRDTQALPVQDNVVALGQRADVPRVLAAADVIVSSSAYGEGFSNALAEGMASGLVPIATDVGDAKAMLGDTGHIVPPGDIEALAGAIALVRDMDPQLRLERGLAARARIAEHFTLPAAAVAFRTMYGSL